jgi:hypothetical protein
VGAGGLLLQSGGTLTNAALICAGFAAVPLWLKALRDGPGGQDRPGARR